MGVSGLVVVPDATKEFSAKISDGGKNAAGDDLSLNFGEPDFDLVKPGRIVRYRIDQDLGMTGQEERRRAWFYEPRDCWKRSLCR